MMLLLHLDTASAVAATTAELFESPHTLQGTLDRPSSVFPGQGRALWTVQTTSDGRHGWAVATIATTPGVYVPPGHQGLGVDYESDGDLILWRWVSVAVEYDHVAKTARRCETHARHTLSPDGVERVNPSTTEHLLSPLEGDLLRNWLWGALGDSSMEMARHQDTQNGRLVEIPLYTSAEWTLGKETYRATLMSFVPNFDPAVKHAALVLLRECEGEPEQADD